MKHSSLSLLLLLQSHSARGSSLRSNLRFDPANTLTATSNQATCAIPPYQNITSSNYPSTSIPPKDFCPSSTISLGSLSAENIHSLAVQYAPVLFFHPLETFTMAAVEDTFANSTAGNIIFDIPNDDCYDGNIGDNVSGTTRRIFRDTLDLNALLQSTIDPQLGFQSDRYSFQHDLLNDTHNPDYVYGAGYTSSGLSRAPLYYRAFSPDNSTSEVHTVVISYFSYYAFTGFANFDVVTSLNQSVQVTRAVIAPYNAHETGWHVLQVWVCAYNVSAVQNQTLPLAVGYDGARSHLVTDCTAGDCVLYRESTHPVAFVSLHSHDMSPMLANELLLHSFEMDVFMNLQGVWAVDRSALYDSQNNYRMFLPNETNIIALQELSHVPSGNVSDFWLGFAGTWGTTQREPPTSPMGGDNTLWACIIDNQTAWIDCPTKEENPLFQIVLELLGVVPASSNVARTSRGILLNSVRKFYRSTGQSPGGPYTMTAARKWIKPANDPIWSQVPQNNTSQEYCSEALQVPDEEYVAPNVHVINLFGTVYGVIGFCLIVMMANVVVFSLVECLRPRSAPLGYATDGTLPKPNWRFLFYTQRQTYNYTFFYAITMLGAGLFFVGNTALNEALQILNLDIIQWMTRVIKVFISLLIAIDTIFLIAIWVCTHDLWVHINEVYYDTVGDAERSKRLSKRWWWRSPWALLTFRFMQGILFSSIMFSTLAVVFACFNIGIAYGIGEVCRKVSGVFSKVCFHIDALGMLPIQCGVEFQAFCTSFAEREIVITVWGSFIMAGGHFYLISSAGAAANQFRVILGTIAMIPSREEYIRGTSLLQSLSQGEKQGENECTQPPHDDDGNGEAVISTQASEPTEAPSGLLGASATPGLPTDPDEVVESMNQEEATALSSLIPESVPPSPAPSKNPFSFMFL